MDNSLNCDRFEEHIQSLMDQGVALANDTQLQIHAQACESCGKLLENFSALEFTLKTVFPTGDGVDDLFAVDFDGGLCPASTTSSLVLGQSKQQKRQVVGWMATGSAVAAAVVLFLLGPNWLDNRSTAENDPVVVASLDVESAVTELVVSDIEEPQLSVLKSSANRFGMAETLPISLRNAYGYAAELPGVRPLECSVNVTIEMLQRSFGHFSGEKQIEKDPDLGHFVDLGRIRTA